MTGRRFSSVLAAGLLVIAGVSLAHAGSFPALTAKVPFDFRAGDQTLPAGEYRLDIYSNGMMAIQSQKSYECLTLTSPTSSTGNETRTRLVFHRYGDQYFLSEVFSGGGPDGRRLSPTKLEKENIRSASRAAADKLRQSDVIVLASR